jgi:hypothetical protein
VSLNIARDLKVSLHPMEDYLDTAEDTKHYVLDFPNKVEEVRL